MIHLREEINDEHEELESIGFLFIGSVRQGKFKRAITLDIFQQSYSGEESRREEFEI